MRQTPQSQCAPDVQRLPHRPQLLLSALRSTQTPLQSVSPAAQPDEHTPLTQLLETEHRLPHAPQFEVSVASRASQPLVAFASQFAYSAEHAPSEHTPALQTALALA
jgi:hypothetical protein